MISKNDNSLIVIIILEFIIILYYISGSYKLFFPSVILLGYLISDTYIMEYKKNNRIITV